MDKRLTLGGLEKVIIPVFGIEVLAKVDTGAFSGALHCENITVERHGDRAVLHFTPLDTDNIITTEEFHEVIVRSAHGHEQVRYIIPLEIEIHSKRFPTEVGLTDRTTMKRDMLLGRRFLLENQAIVDVSLTKDIDDEAERINL